MPESTEELMESGIYMVWAGSKLMEELKEKITRQLYIVGRLIELTEVRFCILAKRLDLRLIYWAYRYLKNTRS